MPTTYAHYRFGNDVLDRLPDNLKRAVKKNRELFNIGVHGPDILFYNHPMFQNHVTKTGIEIHDLPASQYFQHALQAMKKVKNKSAARAYLYGFICHFVLDSECHPYVEKMIHVSGISHSELEMEFDRFLMTEDGLDPLTFHPARHIKPSAKNSHIIAPFFIGITEREIRIALQSMIWTLLFLKMNNKVLRKIVFKLADLLHLGKYKDMFMSYEANPACMEYNEILYRQYNEAVDVAVELILSFQQVMLGNEELPVRFNLTFCEGDDWEALVV